MESAAEPPVQPTDICNVVPEAVYGVLDSSRKGLTTAEAEARLGVYGENVLTRQEAHADVDALRRASREHVRDPAVGRRRARRSSPTKRRSAWAIILVILLNAVFAFVQEYRAEKAIEALKNMLPPKAKVIRDGQMHEIEARTLVPGDLMVVEEGDLISADARLVYSADLRVDNSALTGEVDPVVRRADALCSTRPSITDVESFIFTGSHSRARAGARRRLRDRHEHGVRQDRRADAERGRTAVAASEEHRAALAAHLAHRRGPRRLLLRPRQDRRRHGRCSGRRCSRSASSSPTCPRACCRRSRWRCRWRPSAWPSATCSSRSCPAWRRWARPP